MGSISESSNPFEEFPSRASSKQSQEGASYGALRDYSIGSDLYRRVCKLLDTDASGWKQVPDQTCVCYSREIDEGLLVLKGFPDGRAEAHLFRNPALVNHVNPAHIREHSPQYAGLVERIENHQQMIGWLEKITDQVSPFDWEVRPHDFEQDGKPPAELKSIQAVVGDSIVSLAKGGSSVPKTPDQEQEKSDYSIFVQKDPGETLAISSREIEPFFQRLELQQSLFETVRASVSNLSLLDWKLMVTERPLDDCKLYRNMQQDGVTLEMRQELVGRQDVYAIRRVQPDGQAVEVQHPDFEELFFDLHDGFQERRKEPIGLLSGMIDSASRSGTFWFYSEDTKDGQIISSWRSPIAGGFLIVARHLDPDQTTRFSLQVSVEADSGLADLSGKVFLCQEAAQFFERFEAEQKRKQVTVEAAAKRNADIVPEVFHDGDGAVTERYSLENEQGTFRVSAYAPSLEAQPAYFIDYAPGTGVSFRLYERSIFASEANKSLFEKFRKHYKTQ